MEYEQTNLNRFLTIRLKAPMGNNKTSAFIILSIVTQIIRCNLREISELRIGQLYNADVSK